MIVDPATESLLRAAEYAADVLNDAAAQVAGDTYAHAVIAERELRTAIHVARYSGPHDPVFMR